MINIKIKRLTDTATLPTKAHPSDACFDIYADCPYKERVEIKPKEAATINTGFATNIPNGYFAAVFPRSGMGIKRHLRLSNSTGIIDSGYVGEWLISIYNDGNETQIIKHSDRIAQFAILPVLNVNLNEINELGETDRGANGFGSSGT